MKIVKVISAVTVLTAFTSCAVVRPGEVGVKQKLGKLSEKIHAQGPVWFNPFTTKVIKTNIQINDIELSLSLPSKEGLSVTAQISILYRIGQNSVPKVIKSIGLGYETIISNVFRSASADVCSKYFAKDMHSGMRAEIENAIKIKMEETLADQGILVQAVLMKSIQLPTGLASSIEQKLQAEQDAMRMVFILQQEKLDAERKTIEATGTRDAQKILSEGLTDQIIKIRSIEAFIELSKSTNSKIIITDGKVPYLID
ncbi:MAG: prohibitin family protein [Bacteroidetes bacterium]|nr:prohibitin family protein [Candidatus Vicinibacter affinis]MBK6572341.1 prohibitin family protein [Candidatus Vicinibacter affinis]MBK6825139.1 prohibitin family protein [Candidatus Vicinibacter affinis]MBK7799074.1 prohibitin family protein [Candidatus Vicinibacter affinis]MBK8875941.1 prohibitin family protein [Bacteroidota bacterium]